MKKFITWKCDICDALFEFDSDFVPIRCPDCLSSHEHLCKVGDDTLDFDIEDDDE